MSTSVASGATSSAHTMAIEGTPGVIWVAFAVASAAGLVGSALLFPRSAKSSLAFGISLISAAIYYGWIYGLSGTGADRPGEELIIAGVVGTVTLAFLSRRAA